MIAASPAPWVIGSNGASVKVVDSEGKAVCMLTPRRDQFNGDLIAAAPDLLEAIITLLNVESAALHGARSSAANNGLDVAYHFNKARAAIAKATGENT
jgi:hypothetical protein